MGKVSCAQKDKVFKTSEASTKSWFRVNGIIDEYLNILDYNKFLQNVTKFSQLALEKYGVEGRIFGSREITGTNQKRYFQAVPNTMMFKQIDEAKRAAKPKVQPGEQVKEEVETPVKTEEEIKQEQLQKEKEAEQLKIKYQQSSFSQKISDNPELQEYIVSHLAKMYPNVQIFTSIEKFEEFVAKNYGDVSNINYSALGAAFANAVYINPDTAHQDTYFHEHAHIYWDSMPDDTSIKKRLLELFDGNEETVIEAIGISGTQQAEVGFSGTKLERFLDLMRLWWAQVKNFFKTASKDDLAIIMADNIWNNKDKFTDPMAGEVWLQTVPSLSNDLPLENTLKHQYYYPDGTIVPSATQVLQIIKQDNFSEEMAAAQSASKVIKEAFEKGEDIRDQRDELTKQFKQEWNNRRDIGTALDGLITAITTGEQEDKIPEIYKKWFEFDENNYSEEYESFVLAVNKMMEEINPDKDPVDFQKLLADKENFIAGKADMIIEGKESILYDFKSSNRSFYNADGTLADWVTVSHSKYYSPMNSFKENKKGDFTIQTNIYANMFEKQTGRDIDKINIIPIAYDYDAKTGRIRNVRFEKLIPINRHENNGNVKKTIQKLIEWNGHCHRSSMKLFGNTSGLHRKLHPHMVAKMKEARIELNKLIMTLSPGKTLATMPFSNIWNIMEQDLNKQGALQDYLAFHGWSNEEILNMDLFTACQIYFEYNGQFKENVTVNPMPASQTGMVQSIFENKKTAFMKLVSKIGSISQMNNMTLPELMNIRNQLLAIDLLPLTKNILQYVNKLITYRELHANIIAESQNDFTDFAQFTYLAYMHFKADQMYFKRLGNSWGISSHFVGNQDIGDPHVSSFLTVLSQAHAKMGIDVDNFRNRWNRLIGRIKLEDVTFTDKRGRMFFKDPNMVLKGSDQEMFLNMVYKVYEYTDQAWYARDIMFQNKGARNLIEVPKDNPSKWQYFSLIGKGKTWNPIIARALFNELKEQPWDKENVSFRGKVRPLSEIKDEFVLPVGNTDTSLSDLRKILKELNFQAKQSYLKRVNQGETTEKERTERPIKYNPRYNSRLSNKYNLHVVRMHLESKIQKKHMDPVIPFSEWVLQRMEGKMDTKNNIRFVKNKTDKLVTQTFGGKQNEFFGPTVKWVRFMNTLSAMNVLAWNIKAQMFNLSIGQVGNVVRNDYHYFNGFYKFLTQNLYFDSERPIMHKYFGETLKIPALRSKTLNILENQNILDVNEEYNLTFSQKGMGIANDGLMYLIKQVESVNHGIALATYMSRYDEWNDYDKNGNLKPGKKSSIQKDILRKHETVAVHGNYAELLKETYKYTVAGQFFGLYAGWLPRNLMNMFGPSVAHNGVHNRGYFMTLVRIVHYQLATLFPMNPEVRAEKLKSLNDMKDAELLEGMNYYAKQLQYGRLKWSDLTKSDQDNLRSALTFLTIFSSMVAYLMSSDDDEKQTLLYYTMQRLTGDMFVLNPSLIENKFNNPIPALETITRVGKLFTYISGAITGADWAYYSTSGGRGPKGSAKWIPMLFDVIPMGQLYNQTVYKKAKVDEKYKKFKEGFRMAQNGSLYPAEMYENVNFENPDPITSKEILKLTGKRLEDVQTEEQMKVLFDKLDETEEGKALKEILIRSYDAYEDWREGVRKSSDKQIETIQKQK